MFSKTSCACTVVDTAYINLSRSSLTPLPSIETLLRYGTVLYKNTRTVSPNAFTNESSKSDEPKHDYFKTKDSHVLLLDAQADKKETRKRKRKRKKVRTALIHSELLCTSRDPGACCCAMFRYWCRPSLAWRCCCSCTQRSMYLSMMVSYAVCHVLYLLFMPVTCYIVKYIAGTVVQ